MTIFKRAHGWILLIGLGLVLLAAATWLIEVKPVESATVSQRVLVQEAVNDLNACLTCHSSPAPENQLTVYRASHPDSIFTADDRTVLVAADLQARLDQQLVDTGQRILNLPETNAPAYQTVLTDYLQIYESSRATTDQQILLSVMDRLGQLEELLKVLEHQAAPYRWKAESSGYQLVKVDTAALSTIPPPTNAAIYQHPFSFDMKLTEGKCWIDMSMPAPVRIVFAAYRRGPPAAEMFMESV